MTTFKHASYVGVIPELQGHSALIQEGGIGVTLAQFDSTTLILEGQALGFTWTPFPSGDFKVDEPSSGDFKVYESENKNI